MDFDFRHFSVTIIGRRNDEEPNASLDVSADPDSVLRPPIPILPLPPATITTEDSLFFPPRVANYQACNANDVGTLLTSLHHEVWRMTNFKNYAVLVMFDPGYQIAQSNSPSANHQRRLFPRAPHTGCTALIAVSGHRMSFFSAGDALRYQAMARHLFPNSIMPRVGVHAKAILPYLLEPRWTQHRADENLIQIELTGALSATWMERIQNGGVFIPENPHKRFDTAAFEIYRRMVFATYLDWLRGNLEYVQLFSDRIARSYPRPRSYMSTLYPTLRDWMNHALTGAATHTVPTWAPHEEPPVNHDLLVDLGSFQESVGTPTTVNTGYPLSPVPIFFPTWATNIAHASHYWLTRFFSTPPSVLTEAQQFDMGESLSVSINGLLHSGGLLRGILAEIGSIECEQIQELHRYKEGEADEFTL